MNVKNAFSAFNFAADDATIDTLRTDLAFALRQFIERSNMSQKRAGYALGLKQSVVSQIVRGDIEHLSIERLIRAMVRAKITGFAEWGAFPDLARAGAGFRPMAMPSVLFRMPVGAVYTLSKPTPTENVADVPVVKGAAPSTRLPTERR